MEAFYWKLRLIESSLPLNVLKLNFKIGMKTVLNRMKSNTKI